MTTRVLVVDGHPVVRFGIEGLLNATGDVRVVGGCGEGEEALRLVWEVRPDLVILGLNLTGEKDGFETCRLMKSSPEAPYVLVYTGYDFAEDLSSCVLAGADSYLRKRAGHEDLLSRGAPPRERRSGRWWERMSGSRSPAYAPSPRALD